MVNKTCSRCKHTYPSTSDYFHRDKTKPDGFSYWCKSCRQQNNAKWRSSNAARAYYKKWYKENRDTYLRRKYDIGLDEYNAILEAQGYVCAICGGEEMATNGKGRAMRLSVDHDHETGKVRGLLCHNCNTAIGLLGDDISRVEVVLDYLRNHSC